MRKLKEWIAPNIIDKFINDQSLNGFQFAVFRNKVDTIKLLASLIPDTIQTLICHSHYAAFKRAADDCLGLNLVKYILCIADDFNYSKMETLDKDKDINIINIGLVGGT